MFLIIFEEVSIHASEKISKIKQSSATMAKKITDLEKELYYAKENLQATIEELESSNEELQSTNEELQSTNEEIGTSKEELQALNEELIIVNMELQTRIDQLASVNDDMNNLFNSTEIAAILLDSNLYIKRFTPKAQDLIHLIPADIGRSISHFATNIKYEGLLDDIKAVLKGLVPKAVEVESKDNKYYFMRILPYRTLQNIIFGVVITFTDITLQKLSEKKLEQLKYDLKGALFYKENLLNAIREPLLLLNTDLKIITANHSLFKLLHVEKDKLIDHFIYDLNDLPLDTVKLCELLKKVATEDVIFEDIELAHSSTEIGTKKLIFNARKITHWKSENSLILLSIEVKQ